MEPVRLLDEPGLTATERLLLEDMSRPPVQYDVAGGVARFRTTLVTLGALGVAATAAKSASASGFRAFLGKLSLKLAVWIAVPSVVAGVAAVVLVAGPDLPLASAPVRGAAVRAGSPPRAPAREESPAPRAAANPLVGSPGPERAGDGVASPGEAAGAERPESPRSSPRARGGQRALSPERAVAPREAAPLEPQRVELEETDEPQLEAPAARVSVPEPSTTTAVPAASASAAPPASDTVREMQGIVRARALLSRDPAAALAALDAVRRAFPRGFFVEERRALTIFALRRAGNLSAAKTQAAAFLKQYPDGPFTDKVRAVAAR